MATWQAFVAANKDHYDLVGEYATEDEARAALEAAVTARYNNAYWCNDLEMTHREWVQAWGYTAAGYIRANFTRREKRAQTIAWHEAELARLRAEEAQEAE